MLRVYFLMLAAKLSEDIETARWINEGLDVLSKVRAGSSIDAEDAAELVRSASRVLGEGRAYQRLVIHRYFPHTTLGDDFGMLNFGLDQVLAMIDEGEHVTLTHDCQENNCVLE
jgi:hypothetical protein